MIEFQFFLNICSFRHTKEGHWLSYFMDPLSSADHLAQTSMFMTVFLTRSRQQFDKRKCTNAFGKLFYHPHSWTVIVTNVINRYLWPHFILLVFVPHIGYLETKCKPNNWKPKYWNNMISNGKSTFAFIAKHYNICHRITLF